MPLSFDHGLELTSIKVYELKSNGGWKSVQVLKKDKKYRFRLRFKNTNSTAHMPPFNEPHSHLELYAVEMKNVQFAKFYASSAYSGTGYSRGTMSGTLKIFAKATKTVYFYFIFKSPSDVMPILPVTIGVKLWSAVTKGYKAKTLMPYM